MPYLVKSLDHNVARRLEQAYCVLARAWLRSPQELPGGETMETWRALAGVVHHVNQELDLASAHTECGDIDPGPWARVEVLNSLRHMEVLLGAIDVFAKHGIAEGFRWCAPTQQHLDHPGESEVPVARADLEGVDVDGRGIVLEAYGGTNYRNNSKLSLDLKSIFEKSKAEPSDARFFLACRGGAIVTKGWNRPRANVSASCSKRHGGPFHVSATLEAARGDGPDVESSDYLLIEVTNVRIGSSS